MTTEFTCLSKQKKTNKQNSSSTKSDHNVLQADANLKNMI